MNFAAPWMFLLFLPLAFAAWRLLRKSRRAGIRFSAVSRLPKERGGLRALLAALSPHEVTWLWVKGHAGHELNERADELATRAADGLEGPLLEDVGYNG